MKTETLLDEFSRIGLELALRAYSMTDADLDEWIALIDRFDHDAMNERDDRKAGLSPYQQTKPE